MLKKTRAAAISDCVGKMLARLPLEPNLITLASVFTAIIALLVYDGSPQRGLVSFSLFLVAFAFDVVDGAMARAKGLVTKKGAFLDGIADRIVEFCLLLTLFFVFSKNAEMQIAVFSILFFGTCMTAFVKAYAEHQGVLDHKKAAAMGGILERAERSVLLLLTFAFLIFGYQQYAAYAIYLTAAFSVLTFFQRFFYAIG